MTGGPARDIAQQTIVVTGAGGFLGSSVAVALHERGARVRAHLGPRGFVGRELPASIQTANAEITDATAMRSIVSGSGTVIHLAGPPSVRASFDAAADYCAVHAVGTTVCLQACVDEGVRRFVYISSADVYGRPLTDRVAEDHPLCARSPYAAAKIGAEQMVFAFAHSHGIDAVILRPFSIYGGGMSPLSLLSTILAQARGHDEIVLADLKPERDYCYVGDFAEAASQAAFVAVESPAIVNVGTGTGTSVAALANAVLRVLGRRATLIERPRDARPAGSEIYRLVADPRRAQAILQWQPAVDLESGIRKTVDAMS